MESNDVTLGKVSMMALNATQEILALYTDPTQNGKMVVFNIVDENVLNVLDTGITNADGLAWCGVDSIALTFGKNLFLCGPEETKKMEFPSNTDGIHMTTEVDGLRIMTPNDTHFMDIVDKKLLDTFQNSSIEPSAKLHTAQKSVDFSNPKANEIIRELGDQLKVGIQTLLDAASKEHFDVQVLKHLLVTASFAKKFTDPSDFDPANYVKLVRETIVYTKLRHSKVFCRSITKAQADKVKPKNLLRFTVKYRDYSLALQLVELANMRHLMSNVYEDWCQNMIRYSTKNDDELENAFRNRFIHLAKKLAVDQGFSYAQIDEMAASLSSQSKLGLAGRIKLNIDFTKLAKLAHNKQKKRLSDFLIQYEK